jgi:predicted phosphodiesterase
MALSKLAVIGDIHSNALALRAALRSIADYESNFSAIDSIVFLGDLLTYGVQPEETLGLIKDLALLRPSVVVLGNHDQMYIDFLTSSSSAYYNKLPGWIKESVDFNLARLDADLFLSIDFVPYFFCNDAIVSHANFSALASGHVDWSYVNTMEDHLEQLLLLARMRSRLGILGHTHRSRCFSLEPPSESDIFQCCVGRLIQPDIQMSLSCYPCSILNAGSIGQPRDSLSSSPSWLLIEFEESMDINATFVSFDYDIEAHLKDVSCSVLTDSCIRKLHSFFAKNQ